MYEFHHETILNAQINTVFDFFSDAQNLERITPTFLGFHIITPTPIKISQGTLIDYKLRIHGIPMRWQTHISEWNPPYSFTDEQLKGPYQQWIHRHTFESIGDGNATLMRDHVRYSIFAGKLVHFLIKKDIQTIFKHRTQVIESIFNTEIPSHAT